MSGGSELFTEEAKRGPKLWNVQLGEYNDENATQKEREEIRRVMSSDFDTKAVVEKHFVRILVNLIPRPNF